MKNSFTRSESRVSTINFAKRKLIGSLFSLVLTLLSVVPSYSQTGRSCATPEVISGLPFVQTGYNTAGFNNVTATPCNALYIGGDDYVFTYTPSTNENISISLTNTATWVGIHVTNGCPSNVGVTCVGFQGTSAANPSIPFISLSGGVTYFITISTYPAPQTTTFDINIQRIVNISRTTVASGLWSSPATWAGGVVPAFGDTVIIGATDSVIVDLSPTVARLEVNGRLRFNAAAARNLASVGDVVVNAGGFLSTVPVTGTSLRRIFIGGNLIIDGTADLSSGAAGSATDISSIIFSAGATVASISGSGTLLNGNTIREIEAQRSLTFNMPVNVSARLRQVSGLLNPNGNLTLDNTIGGVTTPSVYYSHSVAAPNPSSQFAVGSTALLNIEYTFFTGQTAVAFTTGPEIPASRTINALRVNTTAPFTIGGGTLTITSANTSTTISYPATATAPGALILSNGEVTVPSGSEIILNNPTLGDISNTGAGAYIRGKLTRHISTTAASTRTFWMGNNGARRNVVLGGINTGGTPNIISVETGVAPGGTTVAPISTAIGTTSYRIQSSAALNATATVQLNWTAQDSLLIGTQPELRIVQGSSITGTANWTERSATSGTGSIPTTGSRTTTAGIDLANGEFFAFGTTSAPDVTLTNILTPNPAIGCYGSAESVSVNLRSVGITIDFATTPVTISGTVVNPDLTTTSLTPVSITSGTLASLANQTVTFTSPINMSAKGTYQFTLITTGDGNVTNDTLRFSIRNNIYSVSANPSTIGLGGSSTLSANGINVNPVRITELLINRGGTGSNSVYPAFAPGADIIELTNLSGTPFNISGDSIIVLGVGARTFVIPPGVVIPGNGIALIHLGTGTNDSTNRYYNTGGANDAILSSSASGFIYKRSTIIIDAVAINSFIFPVGSGVSQADWSGNIPSSSGRAGVILTIGDNNSATNWVLANTPTPLQTIGALNAGLASITVPTLSWTGPSFTASGNNVSTGTITVSGTRTYNVTINANGCITNDSTVLTVLPPAVPQAGFTASSLTATTGGAVSTVTFTDTSLNFPSSWNWTFTPSTVTFVGSTSATSQNPQVQFTAPGLYTVKLVVSNVTGSDSVTRNNLVNVSFVYCPSNATNPADTKIDTVRLGSAFVIGTSPTVCETYTDNSGVDTIDVQAGTPFSFEVRNGSCSGNHFASRLRVFVDLDRDGSFNGTNELLYTNPANTTALGTISGTISIPAAASLGVTRLRVVLQENGLPNGCGTFTYGETEDYAINITAPPACIIPSGLTSSAVGSTTATVRWIGATPSIGYRVQYGVTGFTLGTGTTVTVTDTAANLTGLLPQTTYQFYVRNLCTSTDSSAWATPVSFTTLCAPAALPFTETFDSTSTSVACWSAGTGWALFNVNATATPGRSVRFNFFNVTEGTRSNLVSAPLAAAPANHRLRFAHSYATYTGGEADTLIVYTSANNGTTWTQLVVLPGGATGPLNTAGTTASSFAPTTPAQWSTFSIGIPAGTNLIRFEAVSDFGNNLFLDNVTVEPLPSCAIPSAVVVSSITTTGASINWTENGTATNWQVQYGVSGFTLGSGTSVTTTTKPLAISGLSNSTNYQVYVRAICAPGDTSAWSLAGAFATVCTPASIPYSQNFDGVTAPTLPACIVLQNAAAPWFISNGTGLPVTGPPVVFPSAPNAMVTVWNSTLPSNSWFYTRALTLTTGQTYRLTFDYLAPGFAAGENLRVTLNTDTTSTSVSGTIWQRTGMLITLPTVSQADTTFVVPSSGVYYLGFQTFSPADEFLIAVDNISVATFIGFNDNDLASGLSVFPNPSTGTFNIRIENAKANAQVTVRDLAGKQILSKNLNSDSGFAENTLDMSEYAKGVYYATIINGSEVRTVKLTLE